MCMYLHMLDFLGAYEHLPQIWQNKSRWELEADDLLHHSKK